MLLFLVITLGSVVTSFAQSVIANPTGAGQVSDRTAQVSADLYGAVGAHYKIVVMKKTSSTNFLPEDSAYVVGNGFTNPVPVMFTLDSLNPSTTYYYEFRLYKAYGDSGLIQTTAAGYYFTTTATPASGTITSVTVQSIVGGLRLIVTGNTNGSTSNLVAYTNQASYTGNGWVYQSETDVLPGVFSSFTDTLVISNLSSVSHKIQVRLLPANGMPAVVSSFYYGTPLNGTKPTVNTPTINVGVDTVQIITRVTKGNTDSNWVFVRLLDSVGTTLIATLPAQSVNANLLNYFRHTNLVQNTQYTAEIVAYNSVGRDSVRFVFRTLRKPKTAPPAISWVGSSPVANCGRVTIGGISVVPVSGDTSRVYILGGSTINTMTDILWSRLIITGGYVSGTLDLSIPSTGNTYYIAIIGISKDDSVRSSSVLAIQTVPGTTPTVAFSFPGDGMQVLSTPVMQLAGHGGCSAPTIQVRVINMQTGMSVYDTLISVGFELYETQISLPNFPNGNYRVIANITNNYGSSNYARDYTRNITVTGVRNNSTGLEGVSVFPNPSNGFITVDGVKKGTVTITDMLGQTIYQSSFMNQIDISGKASGNYVLKIENEDGIFTQKILLQ